MLGTPPVLLEKERNLLRQLVQRLRILPLIHEADQIGVFI